MLDGRLQFMEERMIEAYAGLGELKTHLGTVSQAPVLYVGRVATATDGAAADAKLNAASVLLEAAADEAVLSGVPRVALDLSELPGYALFPGQVVAAAGVNARGDRLVVRALYHGAAPPHAALPAASARAAAAAAAARAAGPLRVWAAAGPFCLAHELKYSPLGDLFAELRAAEPPPDVLILQGPFVDADHPAVRAGDLRFESDGGAEPLTPARLWTEFVVNGLLDDLLKVPALSGLHVVIQPAWNDAIAQPVMPQWPLDKADFAGLADDAQRVRAAAAAAAAARARARNAPAPPQRAHPPARRPSPPRSASPSCPTRRPSWSATSSCRRRRRTCSPT
jgi:DNA polymerase alpha subunit B